MSAPVQPVEQSLGVAIMYLLAKGTGLVEVATPDHEGNPNPKLGFAVTVEHEETLIHGYGETVLEAAEHAMTQVPQ